MRRRLHNSGLYARCVSLCKDQLCVYPSTDDREGPTYLEQENTFPGLDSDGLLYFLQISPDSHWRAIQDVCSSGENETQYIINPTLLKETVTKVGKYGLGWDLGYHLVVTLTCMCSKKEL
ncbi:DDE_3 domain-containing protein [Trichonephila clavipes]|nr:DDE_3 domain-containing protein [Trichonephila clavipes]